MAARMLTIGQPPFNVAQYNVFPHLISVILSNLPMLNFPPFKIFLSLELKSATPQVNLKWRFYRSCQIN
jgi:hypothetical protein